MYFRLVLKPNTNKTMTSLSCTLTPLLPVGFSLNQAVCMCLSNCTTHQAILLKSCSNAQKTWQVFESVMKNNFLFFGFSVRDSVKWSSFRPFRSTSSGPRHKLLDQWFSKFLSHSSLINPNTVNSSPTKITNDHCRNFTQLTVKKQ